MIRLVCMIISRVNSQCKTIMKFELKFWLKDFKNWFLFETNYKDNLGISKYGNGIEVEFFFKKCVYI